jgi:hypothetical protein
MSFPKTEEIQSVILLELDALGGEGSAKEICQRAAEHFPQMSTEEANQKLKYADKKWPTLVRFARLRLVENGEVAGPRRGVWAITNKGRQRIGKKKR